MKFILYFSLLLFVFPRNAEAQTRDKKLIIAGTILDVNGTPVSNAKILIDGKATNTRSDDNGNYTIKVRPSAQKIGVIAAGTGFLEYEIDGETQVDFIFDRVTIEPENEIKTDGIVENTGYGTVKKKYSADAVGFLDVEHSTKKFSSIEQILMETPGLTFINGMYIVRGSRNFQGFVTPLYVVDDVALNGCPSLSPSEVASVTVLKGGSASIYGSRAYGGVVIIKTRIQ